MPAAVAAEVAGYFFAEGTIGYALTYAVAYAATTYALSKAAESLTRKPGKTGAGSGLEIAEIDSTADGRIIYGSIRTSGVNVIPPLVSNNPANTKGNDGAYLHQILALAAHEVDSFGDVYLDDDQIPSGDINSITGALTDGKVASGSTKYKDAAWLRRYAGTTTQNVDFILNAAFPSSFTSTFRGRGIAYIAAQFDWGKGKVYTGGVPGISVVVNGKKCYDPRLDTSPGANPTNPTYAAFTVNPALHWADYKTNQVYGQKVATTDIDWSSVSAAADVCDASVSIPTATFQKRYTCSGVFSTNNDATDNEKDLIDAMMGKLSFSGGKWRIFAGAWRAPEFAIAQDDWIQIGSIQTVGGRNDSRYNGVVCYHVDSAKKWQRVECYRRYNDTYKSADGGERIWIEMDQPYCMTEYEAQRKAEFLLRQSRNGIKIVGTLGPRFMKIRTWDNVTVTFSDLGWTSKTFTVASCNLRPDGAVDVVLQEEQDTDWTDLNELEYSNPSVTAIPATNPTTPSELSSFAVTSLLGQLKFDIGEPVTIPFGTNYQILRSPGTLAVAGSYSVVWEGRATQIYLPADPRTAYYYHGRANVTSYPGPLTPNTFGLYAVPYIPPESLPGNRAYPDGEFNFSDARYWTINLMTGGATGSYSLIGSNGIALNTGYWRVAVASNAAPIDGEELSPKTFSIGSAWTDYGVKVLPKQRGTAYVTLRNIGSPAPFVNFQGYLWQVNCSNQQPPSVPGLTTWSNSLALRGQNSGAWVTYVMSFTVPDSGVNAVNIRLRLVPGYTGSLATFDIGAMQIVMQQ